MELSSLGTRKRRGLVSYFIFSVVAGGGIIKGLDSFYCMAGDFVFTWDYFKRCWLIPLTFFITLLRFYVGNVLHMKINEDNPPESSAFPWLVDFCVIMMQFALFYLMGASLNLAQRFLKLLLVLCALDVTWLSFNSLVGWIQKKFARKIPVPWIALNVLCAPFLVYLVYYFKGDLYKETIFAGMSAVTLVFLLFSIAAAIDVFLTDYYLLVKEGYGLRETQ